MTHVIIVVELEKEVSQEREMLEKALDNCLAIGFDDAFISGIKRNKKRVE